MCFLLPRFEWMEDKAKYILEQSRDELLLHLKFLDSSLYRFRFVPVSEDMIATDCRSIFFYAPAIINTFRADRNAVNRFYLHMLLHCILHHPFAGKVEDRLRWDLACDMTVEHLINGMALPCVRTDWQYAQEEPLEKLEKQLGRLSAEKLYRHLLKKKLSQRELMDLRARFYADDHEMWYMSTAELEEHYVGSVVSEDSPNPFAFLTAPEEDSSSIAECAGFIANDPVSRQILAKEWTQESRIAQTQLEHMQSAWGSHAGELMQELQRFNHTPYSFDDFLRRFAAINEVLEVNQEEFDYIYYMYGLQTYRDMPLIEPLEYQELRKLRDFAVVLDTSASLQGDRMQRIVEYAYDILSAEGNAFSHINVHVIQCDAAVQQDVIINSREDMELLRTMELRGLGGTDYRPAFRYVDELLQRGAFAHLQGVLFFTDGLGTFPKQAPAYQVAFVLLDEAQWNRELPAWVIRYPLDMEEMGL